MTKTNREICPLCKQKLEKKELNTFEDYAMYLYSQLCIQSVKLAEGDADEEEIRRLVILEGICEEVNKYAYSHDFHVYGRLDIPKNEKHKEPDNESKLVGNICRVGLSEDGKHAIYELKFVQEIMHYLNEVDTDKSKELLRKMICPNPRKSDMSEEESRLRSMTRAERNAMLYGASLPKDSETLQILRKLDESVKSENCK